MVWPSVVQMSPMSNEASLIMVNAVSMPSLE